MWCVCVCECYKGDIVVMDVIWRRLCISIILESWYICSELGKGATNEAGK